MLSYELYIHVYMYMYEPQCPAMSQQPGAVGRGRNNHMPTHCTQQVAMGPWCRSLGIRWCVQMCMHMYCICICVGNITCHIHMYVHCIYTRACMYWTCSLPAVYGFVVIYSNGSAPCRITYIVGVQWPMFSASHLTSTHHQLYTFIHNSLWVN